MDFEIERACYCKSNEVEEFSFDGLMFQGRPDTGDRLEKEEEHTNKECYFVIRTVVGLLISSNNTRQFEAADH